MVSPTDFLESNIKLMSNFLLGNTQIYTNAKITHPKWKQWIYSTPLPLFYGNLVIYFEKKKVLAATLVRKYICGCRSMRRYHVSFRDGRLTCSAIQGSKCFKLLQKITSICHRDTTGAVTSCHSYTKIAVWPTSIL